MWLGPDARVDNAAFIFGHSRGEPAPISIGLLRVDACEALDTGSFPDAKSAAWFLAPRGAEVTLSRVTYGVVPAGFEETTPAKALKSGGCYVVTITGTGSLRFEVGSDGRLSATERGAPG